jgi:type IV pilus assembly protein PilA
MKRFTKRAAGFTLVELIVVIAVVGVLTAILVPSMMGYTRKAKFAAVNSNAKSLLNAAMLACRESDVTKPIPPGMYTKEGLGTMEANLMEDPIINKFIREQFNLTDTTVWGIEVADDVVVGAFVTTSVDSPFIGTYPHPNFTSCSLSDGETTFAKLLSYARFGKWDE